MKKILFLLVLLSNVSFGQSTPSKYELAKFKKTAEQYVHNFEHYVKEIAEKHNKTSIDLAMQLFDSSAQISVSRNNNPYPIYYYLSKVAWKYKTKYNMVAIQFDATIVNDLVQKRTATGEIYYEGTYSFTQRFCGQKNEVVAPLKEAPQFTNCDYADVTKKTGKIIVKKIMTIEGAAWIVKLGDITVENCVVTSKK